MTDPITPPPELRCQWQSESPFRVISVEREDYMIDRAAQWGADQELEARCEWLPSDLTIDGQDLRSVRRPKPPSLKEQALALLDALHTYNSLSRGEEYIISVTKAELIRRALEALPE
jgi:hypothetical protein